MKKLYSKIPAMIGMLIAVISFGLLAAAFVVSVHEAEPEMGVSRSFALWVFAVITSMLSLIFYLVDALLSIIKAFDRVFPLFNGVLAFLLIGAVPMAIFVGGGLGVNIYIYFSYYLLIFLLEIVSIVKYIKSPGADRISDGEQASEP